jgi:hypothetical protein
MIYKHNHDNWEIIYWQRTNKDYKKIQTAMRDPKAYPDYIDFLVEKYNRLDTVKQYYNYTLDYYDIHYV